MQRIPESVRNCVLSADNILEFREFGIKERVGIFMKWKLRKQKNRMSVVGCKTRHNEFFFKNRFLLRVFGFSGICNKYICVTFSPFLLRKKLADDFFRCVD